MNPFLQKVWIFLLNCATCYGIEIDDDEEEILLLMSESISPQKRFPQENTLLRTDSHIIYIPEDTTF